MTMMPARVMPPHDAAGPSRPVLHPLVVRLTHWLNAAAVLVMVASGWRIYDASPFLPFAIPESLTLGGWLGGALQWHFAGMWLLVTNGLVYLAYGFASGHFRRDFLPVTVRAVARDLWLAATFRLPHAPGAYNAVQRLLYIAVLICLATVILSGLAIWKPVQLHPLTALLGGYEAARRVHFLAMSGIVGFLAVHIALVVLVPRTLPPMITGRAWPAREGEIG